MSCNSCILVERLLLGSTWQTCDVRLWFGVKSCKAEQAVTAKCQGFRCSILMNNKTNLSEIVASSLRRLPVTTGSCAHCAAKPRGPRVKAHKPGAQVSGADQDKGPSCHCALCCCVGCILCPNMHNSFESAFHVGTFQAQRATLTMFEQEPTSTKTFACLGFAQVKHFDES